jgi:glycosyltransferase involved in cell wall biosynthesis
MRIGVDIRVLAAGKRTGIEEYAIGLLETLLPMAGQHEWVLFYNAWHKEKLEFPWARLPWVRVVERSLPNRPLMFASAYLSLPKLNRFIGGCDVFFSPHFYPAAVLNGVPLVTAFHDLGFVHHPEFSSAKKYWWHRLTRPQWQARRSKRIITVSESSKRDLIHLYGIEPEKVSVVYSGISPAFKPLSREAGRTVEQRYSLPKRFILYLGTVEPRKNIVGAMKAFERLLDRGYEGDLVIAGMFGWSYRPIVEAWRNSSAARRISFLGFVAPEDKPMLYNLAECFVYPSFFEGFGFPPLEAMACGVPVITARGSSLPEVAGSAAVLVDPTQVSELSWALQAVLGDASLRRRLREEGLKQARRFSWERAARATLRVLESVV